MYVLAVDDERLVFETLKDELMTVFPGCRLRCERNPHTAIDWARAIAEDGDEVKYAFLDIQMNKMNGLELARQLKTLFPRISVIFCTAYSEYAIDAFGLYAKGYLMKPVHAEDIIRVLDEMVTDWRLDPSFLPRDLRVQTFGNFEVFLDGEILCFEREKAKELFAFLVDRHGTSVTTKEIAATLWEDAPYDKGLKNKTTSIVASMKNTLKEAGIEDVLIKSWNHLAIDTEKIKCDAYDFENMNMAAINSFKGEYMTNYSWAEFTAGKYMQMSASLPLDNDDCLL
ncbi:MAG: response regulator [Oscillospiraceae bacterium]